MGGDDLGYDDEFLLNGPITAPGPGGDETSSVDSRDDAKIEEQGTSKRKRENSPILEQDDDTDCSSALEPTKKKSSWRVMLESGRDIVNESSLAQSNFLWTALTHHTQMKGDSIEGMLKLKPSHFCKSSEASLHARIRDAVSMKKLKRWKALGSPMVVIVCLSARRAVAVLKEVASLKLRAVKLFSKHMVIDDQRNLLQQNSFPIAVGTPNRLLALGGGASLAGPASLRFDETRLVILDSDANQKGYTVCTLPDTAPDTMELVRRHILPQLGKRKDIQIALF